MVKGIISKPHFYPVFGGSLPSTKGGRRSVVLAGVDQDGAWNIDSEDAGSEHGSNEPILFVPFGVVDYALTKDDLKEMMAGMRERYKKKRADQPPPPDMTKAVKDFCQIIVDRAKGKQQFYFKEGMPHGK